VTARETTDDKEEGLWDSKALRDFAEIEVGNANTGLPTLSKIKAEAVFAETKLLSRMRASAAAAGIWCRPD